ncbi:MAG: hypothetical protein ABH879_05195 [archaeon]
MPEQQPVELTGRITDIRPLKGGRYAFQIRPEESDGEATEQLRLLLNDRILYVPVRGHYARVEAEERRACDGELIYLINSMQVSDSAGDGIHTAYRRRGCS